MFSIGNVVTVYNKSGSSVSIEEGTGVTLRLAGSPTDGNRTLSAYGLCTLLCIDSNDFVISGAGLT